MKDEGTDNHGRNLLVVECSYVHVHVDYSVTLYLQIVFAAIEGADGVNSTIAIDDVVMLNRTCPTIAACSFEDGFCGWTNTMQGDDTEWMINQGSTPTEGTGPKYDHTLNTAIGELLTNL